MIRRLKEVIGTNEIFNTLMTNYELPWSDDDTITAASLDFEYINNYSGNKIISPAVDNCLGDDEKITAANFAKLCDVAYMMFSKKWARNWTILTMEYNPIENYSMSEHEELTRDNAETHSGTDSTVTTGSTADAHTGTITDAANNTQTGQVSAFNSSSFQDSDKVTGTSGNTRTHADTDTLTYNNLTNATTHGHKIDNDDDETKDLTRSGNIGVTTSQQMAQSDLELWRWNFFYEVFSDIDNVFTISTY